MSSCHNSSKLVDSTSSSSATAMIPAAAATATTTSSVSKKTATVVRKKKEPKEKRPGRFRTSCPQHLRDRMERAISQRLYLVERQEPGILHDDDDDASCCSGNFVVLGSTGNVYTVTLQGNPCCNCPDWCKREDLCKHLIFVLVKVIGLSTNDPLSYQKAYLPSEVRRLLEMARDRRVGGSVLANRQVQQEFAKAKSGGGGDDDDNIKVQRRSLEQDSDCPICFDDMTNLSETTYCRAQCGFNFHTNCIRLWCQRSHAAGSTATCPACRQPWLDEHGSTGSSGPDDAASKRGVNDEGYVNLGRLQGQSPERDTSTYSPWRGRYNGKRSRQW
jgi:Ring finger domain/SWIM zinc finger